MRDKDVVTLIRNSVKDEAELIRLLAWVTAHPGHCQHLTDDDVVPVLRDVLAATPGANACLAQLARVFATGKELHILHTTYFARSHFGRVFCSARTVCKLLANIAWWMQGVFLASSEGCLQIRGAGGLAGFTLAGLLAPSLHFTVSNFTVCSSKHSRGQV